MNMKTFSPTFEGELNIPDLCDDFIEQMAERVRAGLLVRGYRDRANYRVIDKDENSIRFVADDFWTATNIGLNDVEIATTGPRKIRYRVLFWTWTKFALGLCGAIALVGLIAFSAGLWLVDDMPGASWISLPIVVAGMLVLVMVWPWVLTRMHKRPAAACLERIIKEEIGLQPPLTYRNRNA